MEQHHTKFHYLLEFSSFANSLGGKVRHVDSCKNPHAGTQRRDVEGDSWLWMIKASQNTAFCNLFLQPF